MKRILVIEDELWVRRNLLATLQRKQFDVLGAENGAQGLALARSAGPDLILCDVSMPGKDGYQVLKELRADPSTSVIPFIFLTGRRDKEEFRAGMNLGADDYLTKPFTTDELLAAISARLDRQQSRTRPLTGAEASPDFSCAEPLCALGLTPREAEVLLWVAQGKTNPEISVILGIRLGTVKKHLERVFGKLGVETRTSATRTAMEALTRG